MDIEKLVKENPKLFFWGLVVVAVLLLVCWVRHEASEGFGGAGGLQTLAEQGYFQGSGHEGYSARRLEGVVVASMDEVKAAAEVAAANAAALKAAEGGSAEDIAAAAKAAAESAAALKMADAARSAAFEAAMNNVNARASANAALNGGKIASALAVHNANDLRQALGCKAGTSLAEATGQYLDKSNNGQSWVARSGGAVVQSEGMANLDRKLAAAMNGQ